MADKYYEYYPNMISQEYFNLVLPHLLKACVPDNILDKTYSKQRSSCIFSSTKLAIQVGIPIYSLSQAPKELLQLKNNLEKQFNRKFDYVSVDIYQDHNAHIGVHSEELNSEIVRVSLGATRRFEFYLSNNKKKCVDRYSLKNGDVLHMFGPHEDRKSCQNMYKYQIPKMQIADIIAHIMNKNLPLPSGRKTYESLERCLVVHQNFPITIDLMFHLDHKDI